MRRQLFILSFLAILIIIMNIPSHHTEAPLIPYEQNYLAKIENICPDGIKIRQRPQRVIQFGDLPSPEIGLCAISMFRTVLTIDKQYWRVADEVEKLSLFEHEEGHCVLGLEHRDDPNNYMYFQAYPISKEELDKQVNNDIKENCK